MKILTLKVLTTAMLLGNIPSVFAHGDELARFTLYHQLTSADHVLFLGLTTLLLVGGVYILGNKRLGQTPSPTKKQD